MNPAVALLVCLYVCGAAAQHDHEHMDHSKHRVNVGVYYESLCPDSRKFFIQQLYPSLQGELAQYVNLTLVPYGKTTTEFNINQYEFKCHHGDIECYGNKLHACALHLIDGGQPTPGLGYNKVATGFVNCLMDKAVKNENAEPQMSFTSKECGLWNNVNNINYIDNCANHPDGSNFLAQYGKQTDLLQNPLKSVPTIVFKNQYKEEDSQLAQKNFVKALCQYIDEPKPAECSKNSAFSQSVNVFAMIVALAVAKLW